MIYNQSDLEPQKAAYTVWDLIKDTAAAIFIFMAGMYMFWMFFEPIMNGR